jgi:hypothetical protein
MDWDDTPSSLDTELLEEGSCDDFLVVYKGIWVQQGTSDDRDEDDAESTAKNLRAIPNYCPTSHSSKVCNNLSYCHSIGAEVVLVCKHGRIKVLGSMRLLNSLALLFNECLRRVNVTMKLKPAISKTRYVRRIQCLLKATFPSLIKVFPIFGLFLRTS